MTDKVTFGEQGRHYADFSEATSKPSEATKQLLEQANSFLRKHMPDAEQRIKRTIEQWNQIIRNAIIAETGLRLSVGDDQQNVPVRLHPGMPKSFADIAAQLEPELWELLFNQHLLNTTKSGLQLLLNNGEVLQSRYTDLDFRNRDIECVQYMLQRVIALLEERNFAAQFRAIDQDVLGAYFFHYPEVRIYWMVISLMARFLNVSVEGLTIAVLTHELAHAYTHLGRDVDGSRWETAAFAQPTCTSSRGWRNSTPIKSVGSSWCVQLNHMRHSKRCVNCSHSRTKSINTGAILATTMSAKSCVLQWSPAARARF